MIAKTIRINGHVQGVFFRRQSKDKADELGVTGSVRNCEDGTVEIHAEGEPEAVAKFIDWCHEGPRGAMVESVQMEDAESKDYASFDITDKST
ncbi:MAG: acylphosphatase [Candidatus Peribacteraceae bacterium]|jgi:acylphosphatase|nr:acylphosphatase [Candidatus Peribacteraceae bacterium]